MKMKNNVDVVWVASPDDDGTLECRNDELGVVAYWNPVTQWLSFDALADADYRRRVVEPELGCELNDGKVVWRSDGFKFSTVPIASPSRFLSVAAAEVESYARQIRDAAGRVESDLDWARKVQRWLARAAAGLDTASRVEGKLAGVPTVLEPVVEGGRVRFSYRSEYGSLMWLREDSWCGVVRTGKDLFRAEVHGRTVVVEQTATGASFEELLCEVGSAQQMKNWCELVVSHARKGCWGAL